MLFSSLLMEGCQHEEVINNGQKDNYSLKVTTLGGSRTFVEEDGAVKWSKGDRLYVYGNKVSGLLNLKGNGGESTGIFNGLVSGDIKDLEWAVFGNNVEGTENGAQFSISKITDPNSNSPMVGKINNGSADLEHLCGMLRLTINNLPSNATVKLIGSGISGIAEWNGSEMTITKPEDEITIEVGNGNQVIEIPVFATEDKVEKQFTLSVNNKKCNFKAPIKVGALSANSIENFTCIYDDKGNLIDLVQPTATGIPSDINAGTPPIVADGDKTFEMPTSISEMSVDPDNPKVGRFNLAGINLGNNEWLELYGTGSEEQNVWVEIGGVQKSIKVINSDDVVSRSRSNWVTKAKADVVFLVDNSGSMSEEANKVAEEILQWANKLSQTMDVKFGCVGIDHRYVNGALDITDVNTLSDYLNSNYSGTSRTQHFGQNMKTCPTGWENLKAKASNYSNAGGECGGIMLHFANENFTFREGANRFYVYFTDEPNQPGSHYDWSVLTVKNGSEYYNWSSNNGVIYTVFSSKDNHKNWQNWSYQEDPCLFSTYTGGQIIETDGNFNISLDELPVTGAIFKSFIITFNITPDLVVGQEYDITIIIKSKDGKVISKYTYHNVKFV